MFISFTYWTSPLRRLTSISNFKTYSQSFPHILKPELSCSSSHLTLIEDEVKEIITEDHSTLPVAQTKENLGPVTLFPTAPS